MNCQQFENFISDYLEDVLTPSGRRQCAEHLIECRSCHNLLDDVRAALHACRQTGPVEPLADLSARILQSTTAGEMMSCSIFDELIVDYFDGFISASDFRIFEAHFDTCSRCQRLMSSIQLARELVQEVKSVEIPEGLQERILDATTGADDQARQRERQGLPRRVASGVASWLRMVTQPVLSPEFVTAMLLCLATLGLLLVDFSDDMSLRGIYRQARVQLKDVFHEQGGVSARKKRMASDLREAKAELGSAIQTGLALFSEPTSVAPQPSARPSSDQKQLDDRSREPTDKPRESDPEEKSISHEPISW